MEENEYRDTYRNINPTQCLFEKSINSRRCQCALAQRFNLADREGVRCTVEPAQKRCAGLLQIMRSKAIFAMKITKIDGPLPHGKEIKVQIGGLLGLQKLLEHTPNADGMIQDIQSLLNHAIEKYGGIETFPYTDIVQEIVKFEGRTRKARA
ncbi:MAG: hypothetical protein OEZ39_06985 [Gammaproteobacteria bacterium]|nr:hypothetical protein [Gammaproteobacteria bacterium]MDH5651601.1 hypothetical protein [Gammaproteobacteria bacterium]